jgi:hypothetical protein
MNQSSHESILLEAMLFNMEGKSPSAAIEAQEARGQAELAAAATTGNAQLPTRSPWDELEKAGVKRLGPVDGDDLFQRAELPAGWSIKRTDHSMWSHLLDDKGRKRASIFYKAAFYDRRATLSLDTRFKIESYEHPDYEKIAMSTVKDGDKVVFTSDRIELRDDKDRYGYRDKETGEETPSKRDAAQKQCEAWLGEHYPDWRSTSAYWD